MNSLIKKALASMESLDVKVQVDGAVNTSTDSPAKNDTPEQTTVNTSGDKELTVVMDGPLSNIYHKALNIAFAKSDPVTGVPATESLALTDYYKAIELKEKLSTDSVTASTDDSVDIQTNGTILKAPDEQEAVPVVKELVSSGVPGDFAIIYSAMSPTDDCPIGLSRDVIVVEMDKRISAEDVESFSIVIKLKPNAKS